MVDSGLRESVLVASRSNIVPCHCDLIPQIISFKNSFVTWQWNVGVTERDVNVHTSNYERNKKQVARQDKIRVVWSFMQQYNVRYYNIIQYMYYGGI